MAEESDIYGDSLPQARDFKLDPLLNFALQDLNAIVAVSAPLRNVQRAFGDNIHRLQSTIILPVFNVRFACSLERCVAIAEHEQNGFINIEIATEPMPQRIVDRAIELFHQANQAEAVREGKAGFNEELNFRINQAFHSLVNMSKAPSYQVIRGIEAMLTSLILGMWTTFETMARDLWESAVNTHPKRLSSLDGNWKRLRKTPAIAGQLPTKSEQQYESKQVSLNLIQMNAYDLRNCMGTILRDRFGFDRLDGIREAYGLAFSEDTAQIDAALTDTALDSLSSVRNLLVHRGGRVDKEYEKHAKRLSIPQAAIGEPILLDGEIVVNLVVGAFKAANDLLAGVEEWLTKN